MVYVYTVTRYAVDLDEQFTHDKVMYTGSCVANSLWCLNQGFESKLMISYMHACMQGHIRGTQSQV